MCSPLSAATVTWPGTNPGRLSIPGGRLVLSGAAAIDAVRSGRSEIPTLSAGLGWQVLLDG